MIEEGKLILDRFKLNRKLGCGTFSRVFILKKKYEEFNKEMIQLLINDKEWIIDKTFYDNIEPLFRYMEVCMVSRLCFEDFQIPRPIQDISKIKFINLTQLHLLKNNICSIQYLGIMHFPKLLILDLSRNLIGNLSPLKKLTFPMLSGLYISGNKILSLQPLTTCSLPNLDILQLQWQIDDLSDNFCQWIAKFNSINIRQVRCESDKRIPQKKVYKMIKKWYSQIHFIISKDRSLQYD